MTEIYRNNVIEEKEHPVDTISAQSSSRIDADTTLRTKNKLSSSSIRAFIAKGQTAFDDEFNQTLHGGSQLSSGRIKTNRHPTSAFNEQDLKLEHVLKRREFIGVRNFKDENDINKGNDATENTSASAIMNIIGPILSPLQQEDLIFIIWIEFVTICSLISTFVTPYRLAFENKEGSNKSVYYFELAIDIIFCFNAFIHSVHVFPTNLMDMFPENRNTWSAIFSFEARKAIFIDYVTDKKIAFRLLSAIPWDFLVDALSHGIVSPKVHFGLGLLRFLRLIYVNDAFRNAEKNVRYPYYIIRSVKFLLFFALEAHVFACIFFFVADFSEDYEDTWIHAVELYKPQGFPDSAAERYLISVYWSITTLATVGYGDITPTSHVEYIIAIVYMMFNLFLSAFVIGNMTLLVTQAYESIRMFRLKFSHLETYMDLHRLPDSMRDSLRSYMILKFNVEKEHREILEEFPMVFKSRVHRFLFRPTIDASFFANVASEAFVDALSCVLNLELLMPSTDAVSQYDASFELFLVVSGVCEQFLDISLQKIVEQSTIAPDDNLMKSVDDEDEDDNVSIKGVKRNSRFSILTRSNHGDMPKKKPRQAITVATLGQG